MRELEKTLLTVIIIQKLDRDNVVEFLNISYSKSVEKKFEYRNEEVIENQSEEDDDEMDVDEQEKDKDDEGPKVYQIDVPLDEND